jgi:hypothetical protein
MDICQANKAVSLEVKRFMENVGDIKEETITDYLVWKWRELDKRFYYVSVATFDHHEESTRTGADFDLELWLVGRSTHISLAVQAKKFLKQHDSYVKRLNYPDGTRQQMQKLLAYAKSKKQLPFYFIYTLPDNQTSTMCGRTNAVDCAVFMADARVMEQFADGKHGRRPSRDDLILASNPFHCMFCCPLMKDGSYFRNYFSEVGAADVQHPNEALPGYVRQLLSQSSAESPRPADPQREGWSAFRAVGVYDLRGDA